MSVIEMPLKLESAAQFLGLHPVTLAERARAGKIPLASKPGKAWIFPPEGLRAYRDAHSPCPSIAGAESGGSKSPRSQADLESLLGLPTGRRRRNITKSERARYGGRSG